LQAFTAVTGVSGSGKSTLVTKILYPALARELGEGADEVGKYDKLTGDVRRINSVEFVDQNPIGRSSRSNPVTFVKAWDVVRQLYADQPLAKQRGYKPSHYSFNVDGGRCEACQGEGEVLVPMQFMADLWLPCESCHGKRFKQEVLEVEYNGKNAADLLAMTVDEAMTFFKTLPKVYDKLKPLQDVGLGYITLGQSSSTLSGGEAQRVKLASFLSKGGTTGKVLFIFDEPTTGLHFADIEKLLVSINALVDQGHTVIVIEHNLDMIYAADHIIDLGPEGGINGGQLLFEGTPELMLKKGKGHTADYLRKHVAAGRREF
jgi:excinuclease ABC subunit A